MPCIDDFGLETSGIGEAPADHVVVKVDTLSMDAWIRTTLNDAGMHETADIGASIPALGVGQIVESNSETLSVGDWVYGMLSAQTHALLPDSALTKLDVSDGLEPRDYVGPLGVTTGLTAWVGLIAVADVQPDDVVLVSGACEKHNSQMLFPRQSNCWTIERSDGR